MLAHLLLDADVLTFAYAFLFHITPTAALYLASLTLSLRERRSTLSQMLGGLFACALVVIAFSSWPHRESWESRPFSEYFLFVFLCLPFLLVAARYGFRSLRQPARQKLLMGGVSLDSEDLLALQALLADEQVVLDEFEPSDPIPEGHLVFWDGRIGHLPYDAPFSAGLQPVYAQLQPLLAYVQGIQRVDTIELEKVLAEGQGWPFRLCLVSAPHQVAELLKAVDAVPLQQFRAGRAEGVVLVQYECAGQLTVLDQSA